jgi:glycosyltransferase involved in cell wall biosynthesis
MPKRIAIVSSSCPPVSAGGVSSAQYNLYRALKRKGFDARIFTFGDYGVDLDEREVTRVGLPPGIGKIIEGLGRLYFRIVDPSRLAYSFVEVVYFALPCLKLSRLISRFQPKVLILSDHGCPGLFIAKPAQCRTILVSHHNPARFLNNPLWGLHSEHDSRLTVACENRALKKVDAVVCPSHHMYQMFKKTYEYSGPVTVIPNMVDTELIASISARDIRADLGLSEDSLLIYIPSAGSVHKGSRYVFEIIRRLSTYCVKDIGFYLSGNSTPALEYELRAVPPNAKVYAPGHVSYHDNLAIVKSCSFGISPTLIENFGMAILEANCCGVPMVSFDVGGNADVVNNGKSGFLVPYLDVEGLITAAHRLMQDKCRADMRAEAAKYAASKFTGDVVVEQFVALMNESVA